MRAPPIRYALAFVCIGLAISLHLSPVGPFLHPTGLFLLGVVAAAWFGGAGPGFLAAVLATLVLPQLIPMNYSLIAGFFDLPRFVTFAITGLAVGWGTTMRQRAEAALRQSERELETKMEQRTAALRQSEERYALVMKAGEEGFWDWIVASDEFYASPRMLEMYGFPPDTRFASRADFLGRFAFHPEDRPKWEQAVAAHFAGESARFDIELRMLRNGETRWIHLTGLATRDASGAVVRWTGATRDVTERKRAEAAQRESERRYERVMLASEAGFWDWYVPTDELYVSPKLLEMGGFAAGTRFAGRADFMARAPFHPGDRVKWEHAVKDLFAGADSRLTMELRVIVAGETRWHNLNGICIRDATGSVLRWTGSSTDVTARKCAEEALRLSGDRYALAMEAAGDGHSDWNLETGEFYVSPRLLEIVGYAPGTTFRDRAQWVREFPFHPEERPKWEAAVAEHFAGSASKFRMEARIIVAGATRWIAFTFVSTRDASGRPVRWTGSTADITDRKRAELALRASEERYARAMEGSNAGHWDWHVATDEIFVSVRMKEMFGLRAERQFASRSDFNAAQTFHPEDRQRVKEAFDAALSSGASRYEIEYRILPRPGEVQWVRSYGKIFRDADGRPSRVSGALTDITERKLAADALRESEARFRRLTELSSDWYWTQDENLRYSYFSEYANDQAGYPAESPMGKTRWELPVIPLSCSWPEHQALLAARQPFRDFEYSRSGEDGRIRYISVSGVPVFDEQGRFRGYEGVARNITERKRIEEELRRRQEMLELAQKAARAIAFEWRMGEGEGENRWSPDLEAMYGFAPGTYDGTYETWKRRVHPADWPAVEEAIKHAQRTGEVTSEYRVVHPDDSVHWMQAKGRMFFGADGKPARMVGFMQDVTERRQAQEELLRLERRLRQAQRLEAMGTLAGGIAHDFNNILGAVLGYGEMALRDSAKGSRQRRDLDAIMAAGERGRALVDRVLAFSRSGVGERIAVHVEAVVREVLDLLSGKLPAGVEIHARLQAGRAAVTGDPTQVHQVLMNLATNAIQAMPAGGRLLVCLDHVHFAQPRYATTGPVAAGEWLALSVVDSGTGIPADILERIFDPFFTTKEVGVGSGLGLSLVHGIVTELGGAVDVDSTPGAGSTFTVYLPRSGDALDRPSEALPAMPRGERQRILVVDDEEPLVRIATETLAELGYEANGYTSSAAALAAFRADPQRFDAVITDERMPGMTGSALIREVRGIRDRIPIVLMSGFIGGGVLTRAREAGADDVLKKPLSARELATSLARVLQS